MPVIPATSYAWVALAEGQGLRVIDVDGGQVADLTAFRRGDSGEWLSNGRSFDHEGTLRFTAGHMLRSNRSAPVLEIVADDVGRHDFLYTSCSPEMYRLQYGIEGEHPNCLHNLRAALAEAGQEPAEIPTPFNVFMNVEVGDDGALTVRPPRSKAGDAITFRACMDLIVALSACPAGTCNGGTQTAIAYEVVDLSRRSGRPGSRFGWS